MPFKPGQSGNPLGRIEKKQKESAKKIREREFISLLKRLRPHISSAISTAAKIMQNEEATEAARLKACTILLDNYKQLVSDVYEGDDSDAEDSPEDIQKHSAPVFSMKIIDKNGDVVDN